MVRSSGNEFLPALFARATCMQLPLAGLRPTGRGAMPRCGGAALLTFNGSPTLRARIMFQLKEFNAVGTTFFGSTTCGLQAAGSRHKTSRGFWSYWTIFVHDRDTVHEGTLSDDMTFQPRHSIPFPEGEGMDMKDFLFGGRHSTLYIRAGDRYFANMKR